MNRLNLGLTILLLILVIYGFWPNLFTDLFKWLSTKGFLIQVIATGIGVFGGMWADKKLKEQETTKETLGALEIIDAELQSNIIAVINIRGAINDRPSLANRNTLSLEKALELIKNEEMWIGNYSNQITNTGYYTVLLTISRLKNRKLFEKLVNCYRDSKNIQLVLKLGVMDNFDGNFSDEQKNDFIRIGDLNFNKITEHLSIMEEKLKNVDKEIIEEEKKILRHSKLS